jgi:2-haloacid dehalogenase
MKPSTVVLDIGNVLVSWDPRNVYSKLFDGREEEMEWFLANVCSNEWNLEQDRGRTFAEATELLLREHPEELHPFIRAYDERWHEMLAGEISETVAILERLATLRTPLYAITNWNQDKFKQARELFPFLSRFDGIIVSGDEGLIKPDRAIFELLFRRYDLDVHDCVFIDDSLKNVRGAEAVGMHAIHFTSAGQLAGELRRLGFDV